MSNEIQIKRGQSANFDQVELKPGEDVYKRQVNDLGIQAMTAERATPVYCGRLSVEGKEYHEAAQHGLKPEVVLAVHTEEYSGQAYVDFDGRRSVSYTHLCGRR